MNSSTVSDELCFCVLLYAFEKLPEALGRRSCQSWQADATAVSLSSSKVSRSQKSACGHGFQPNWVIGISPGCFLGLDLYTFGIQLFPITVCFNLRRVKCLWLEVSQLDYAELKQNDFCSPWGALHWVEFLECKNVAWRLLGSCLPK